LQIFVASLLPSDCKAENILESWLHCKLTKTIQLLANITCSKPYLDFIGVNMFLSRWVGTRQGGSSLSGVLYSVKQSAYKLLTIHVHRCRKSFTLHFFGNPLQAAWTIFFALHGFYGNG
jgi:hypothetical protein